jgi:glyoxylase-like metal-dependent hydrolase (beta-lactamase superfamily II)
MSNPRQIADDVVFLRTMMANVFLIRTDGSSWVLVDAGLPGYEEQIINAARASFGIDSPPAAIVLTHGHFDHIGSLRQLLWSGWAVPVFAHRLERPYLTGRSPYPPPDPLVGRGALSLLARMYPRGPIDISAHLEFLPEDGTVPALPGWRWIHTPGHTAGHVSLFRERDRLLLAGDAVTTTKQESLLAVATQRREIHGPPAYWTQDWTASARSVRELALLNPDVLATGHGEPMKGDEMRAALRALAAGFESREVPATGRYATHPAITDEQGIVKLPPDPLPVVVAGAAIAAGLAYALTRSGRVSPRSRSWPSRGRASSPGVS